MHALFVGHGDGQISERLQQAGGLRNELEWVWNVFQHLKGRHQIESLFRRSARKIRHQTAMDLVPLASANRGGLGVEFKPTSLKARLHCRVQKSTRPAANVYDPGELSLAGEFQSSTKLRSHYRIVIAS